MPFQRSAECPTPLFSAGPPPASPGLAQIHAEPSCKHPRYAPDASPPLYANTCSGPFRNDTGVTRAAHRAATDSAPGTGRSKGVHR